MERPDYSYWTVPKAVRESDRAQREDPNYRRPRKLPPRVVYPSVVRRSHQERLAAEAARQQAPSIAAPTPRAPAYIGIRWLPTPAQSPEPVQHPAVHQSVSSATVAASTPDANDQAHAADDGTADDGQEVDGDGESAQPTATDEAPAYLAAEQASSAGEWHL